MNNTDIAIISVILATIIVIPLLLAVRTNTRTMSDLEYFESTGKWKKDEA